VGLGCGTWLWDLAVGLGCGTWLWDLVVGLGISVIKVQISEIWRQKVSIFQNQFWEQMKQSMSPADWKRVYLLFFFQKKVIDGD
jgi:hypothetical protein